MGGHDFQGPAQKSQTTRRRPCPPSECPSSGLSMPSPFCPSHSGASEAWMHGKGQRAAGASGRGGRGWKGKGGGGLMFSWGGGCVGAWWRGCDSVGCTVRGVHHGALMHCSHSAGCCWLPPAFPMIHPHPSLPSLPRVTHAPATKPGLLQQHRYMINAWAAVADCAPRSAHGPRYTNTHQTPNLPLRMHREFHAGQLQPPETGSNPASASPGIRNQQSWAPSWVVCGDVGVSEGSPACNRSRWIPDAPPSHTSRAMGVAPSASAFGERTRWAGVNTHTS